MAKVINVDQVLHGYANGHQLLASSCEFNIDDRNRIDELSDLNGHCEQQEFVDYYTGYPIENGRRYVIAKTWYAYEMRRPGCVWTHSIIFDIEDISQLSNTAEIMELFLRPIETDSYTKYKNKITIQTTQEKALPIFDESKLQYIIYTIFSSEIPKYIIIEKNGRQFDNELFIVLNYMPPEILKTFTFCTMSYDIRKYGKNEFIYQMSIEKNIYRFHRKPCTHIASIKKYPYWVTCYVQELERNRLGKLQCYIMQYGKKYLNLVDYNQFCRLYFATLNRRELSLKEYFDYIDAIMPSKEDVFQATVEHILYGDFIIDIFQNQEYQILEELDMGKFKLKKEHKELLEKKIIEKTPEKLYPILQNYICGKLKPNTQLQVESIIRKLEPEHLGIVSHMDENICVVLVHMNHELLLCKEIWTQPRDFQRAVLHAGSIQLSFKLKKSILVKIMQFGTENIATDIYEFYGDDIFLIIYNLLEMLPEMGERKFQEWMPILLQKPTVLFEHINHIPLRQYRLQLFLKVDLTKVELNTIKKEIWEMIYTDLIEKEHNEEKKMKCIFQFMRIIFGSSYRFDDKVVKGVVKPVYQEAKSNRLGFDAWNQFQNLLPEVEDCFAWDKCLRMRRGLEQKGYQVSLVDE